MLFVYYDEVLEILPAQSQHKRVSSWHYLKCFQLCIRRVIYIYYYLHDFLYICYVSNKLKGVEWSVREK